MVWDAGVLSERGVWSQEGFLEEVGQIVGQNVSERAEIFMKKMIWWHYTHSYTGA